jgi:CBS domain-containing protein
MARQMPILPLMTEHRIRHVPITRDGKLVGIVSIGDVVKRLLEKYEQEAELIKQFINS